MFPHFSVSTKVGEKHWKMRKSYRGWRMSQSCSIVLFWQDCVWAEDKWLLRGNGSDLAGLFRSCNSTKLFRVSVDHSPRLTQHCLFSTCWMGSPGRVPSSGRIGGQESWAQQLQSLRSFYAFDPFSPCTTTTWGQGRPELKHNSLCCLMQSQIITTNLFTAPLFLIISPNPKALQLWESGKFGYLKDS